MSYLNNTLEQLENDIWDEPEFNSSLIEKCHNLRKVPISNFSSEDLRILIGQNIGNKYLIPLAINELDNNILAEALYFEGDLLLSVLKSDTTYWMKNRDNWIKVSKICSSNFELLSSFDTDNSIRKDIFDSFGRFKSI